MDYRSYYDILLDGIDTDAVVSRIVRGISWTAAVLSDGQAGVAMHTEGESFPDLRDARRPARQGGRPRGALLEHGGSERGHGRRQRLL